VRFWRFYIEESVQTVPSLQGTLAKRTKPTHQPNFAKEPFRPSRSNVGLRDSTNLKNKRSENINRQCLTAGKVHRLCCAPGIGTQADFLYLSKQNLMRCNAYDTLPAERWASL